MKFTIKKILKTGLVTLIVVLVIFISIATAYLRKHYTVPIIMYHSVEAKKTGQKNLLAVSAHTFERQMRFLREHRYNVISLRQLVALIKNKLAIPAKTVVITFDDGYRDNLTIALPVLKKYNLPATIFVAPEEISRVPYYLNWDELREISQSSLIEIGAHTVHHAFLPDIKDEKALIYEIEGSAKLLEKKLGKRIGFFSYPAGGFNKKIRQIVINSGYLGAVATKPGIKYPSNDIYALKRMRISISSDNLFIFWFELTGIYSPLREWQRRYKDKDINYGE